MKLTHLELDFSYNQITDISLMYGAFHGLGDLIFVKLSFRKNKINDLDAIFKGL